VTGGFQPDYYTGILVSNASLPSFSLGPGQRVGREDNLSDPYDKHVSHFFGCSTKTVVKLQ